MVGTLLYGFGSYQHRSRLSVARAAGREVRFILTNQTAQAGRPNTGRSPLGGAFLPTLLVLGVLVFGIVVFANFWTELKWFEQVEASRVFWTQYGASIALGAIGFLIVGAVVALNLRIALGKSKPKDKGNVVNVECPKNRVEELEEAFIYQENYFDELSNREFRRECSEKEFFWIGKNKLKRNCDLNRRSS